MKQLIEVLMNGQIQIGHDLYKTIPEKYKHIFEIVCQTSMHGVWVDGYMFANHQQIRKVYRA